MCGLWFLSLAVGHPVLFWKRLGPVFVLLIFFSKNIYVYIFNWTLALSHCVVRFIISLSVSLPQIWHQACLYLCIRVWLSMWATYKLSWAMFWSGDWWNTHKRKLQETVGKTTWECVGKSPSMIWYGHRCLDPWGTDSWCQRQNHGVTFYVDGNWLMTCLTLEDLTQGAKTYLLCWWPRWCMREKLMLALTHEEQTHVTRT